MKLNFYFLLGLVALLQIMSCKKNDVGSNNSTQVKTYIEEVFSAGNHIIDTMNISYDSEQRMTSLASTKGGKFLFTYNTGNFSVDIIDRNNQLTIKSVYYLNLNNLIDSGFQYNDTNDSSTEKYLYNSVNQLVQSRKYDYSQVTGSILRRVTEYVYDASGNLKDEIKKDTMGLVIESKSYTHTNTNNNFNFLILPYYPQLHKKLINTESEYDGSGNIMGTATHQYTFDNVGRLSVDNATDTYGNIVVKKYLY